MDAGPKDLARARQQTQRTSPMLRLISSGPNRRRHWRMEQTLRVDYTLDDVAYNDYTGNISQGGMLLRSARGLVAGDQVDFLVYFEDGGEPQLARGLVKKQAHSGRTFGTGVEFLEGQHELAARIQRVIAVDVLPRREESLASGSVTNAELIELAALYREVGRSDEGLNVYRAAHRSRAFDRVLHEHMVFFFATEAVRRGAQGIPLLDEVDQIIAALGNAAGETLVSLREEIGELRIDLERERKSAELDERERQIDSAVADAVEKAVSLRQAELDLRERDFQNTLRQRFAEVEGELAQKQSDLAQRAQSLETAFLEVSQLREALEGQRRELGLQRQTLREETRKVLEREAALEARSAQLDAQASQLEQVARSQAQQGEEIAASRAASADQARTHAALQEQLLKATQTLQERDSVILELENVRSALLAELAASSEKAQRVESDLQAAQAQVDALEAEVAGLQQRAREVAHQLAQKDQMIAVRDGQITTLDTQITRFKQRAESAEAQSQAADAEALALRSAVEQLRRQNEMLGRELESAGVQAEEITELRQIKVKWQSANAELTRENATLQSQVTVLADELGRLKRDLHKKAPIVAAAHNTRAAAPPAKPTAKPKPTVPAPEALSGLAGDDDNDAFT